VAGICRQQKISPLLVALAITIEQIIIIIIIIKIRHYKKIAKNITVKYTYIEIN